MTTRPHGKITVRVEVDLDDQAIAELVALGWTPPGEGRLGTVDENDRIAERLGICLAPTPDPNDICACGHRFRVHLEGMACGHCATCRGFVAVDTPPGCACGDNGQALRWTEIPPNYEHKRECVGHRPDGVGV